MKTKPRAVSRTWSSALSLWAQAALSGLLLAAAFPPVDWKWTVWFGLSPLLWAVKRAESQRQAFGLAYLAGLVFFLFNLHPLVSAHSWTGWASESTAEFARRMTRQWWFMQGIWLGFVVWCAFWWGLWAAFTKRVFSARPHLAWLAIPSSWILFTEWARSRTTFGFAWGFLGNATADLSLIRQWASLGGVWLLSAIVVLWNLGLIFVFSGGLKNNWRKALLSLIGAMLAVLAVGYLLLQQSPPLSAPIRVAVLQRFKPSYVTDDFAENGFDRSYLPMIQEALHEKAQLLVLPESVALGAVSLDGTSSKAKPSQWQHPRASWDWQIESFLRNSPAALIVGLDTVEKGEDHNTLVAWNAEGPLGWYHKRHRVPFAEYHPWPWPGWAIRGKSGYAAGKGAQLISWNGLALGGFICQEVLFPSAARESVRDGATLLVSGGNDGVFSDYAVARVHADAAQIRAVETGRFLVRAMKTGISDIIDSKGFELARSRSSDPVILFGVVRACRQKTAYVRFGDWVVVLSAIAFLGLMLVCRGKGPGRQKTAS